MKRFIRIRIPLLGLLSGLLMATSVQATPVKLAVLLPSSNIYKDYGNRVKQSFMLGIQEEVTAQKVPWDSWVTLEFFDTRVDADYSLQVAKDVIADGAKAIIGIVSSGVGVKLRDYVLDEARVPLILMAGTVSAKLRTTHPLFIRTTRSVPLQSIALATWLKEHPFIPDAKPRWACIHSDYVYGVGVCDAFKRFYGEVGEEVGRVPVPLKTVNKKSYIVQLAKLDPKPDFALAVFVGAEAETFYRDYYRFKVHQKIPLVTLNASVTPKLLRSYEKTLEQYDTGVGLISSDVYQVTADNAANKNFVTQYQQTSSEPPTYYSVWGYDAGRLLVKALVKLNGQWDGAQVVQLMKTLPYTSPRHGQQLQFDSHGDAINGAYVTKIKRNGNRLVREFIAQIPPINLDEVLK